MTKKTTTITILILTIIVSGFWYVKNQQKENVAIKEKQEQGQEMNGDKGKVEIIKKREIESSNEDGQIESNQEKQEIKNKNNKIKKDIKISGGIYDGWNEYYNTKYNFTINYPSNMDKDDNYENSTTNNIVPIVSFNNFSKNRIGYMNQDGDLAILIKLYCANEDIDFKSCYESEIKYTKEKKQKEISFIKEETDIDLSEKDIIYKESEINIHSQLFKMQYRKYLKPNYIEGGPVVIKEYASIYRDKIYNITCITPNTENADRMINLADKIVGSLKFDGLNSL